MCITACPKVSHIVSYLNIYIYEKQCVNVWECNLFFEDLKYVLNY